MLINMKQFTLWYETEDDQRVGDVVKIKSQTKEEAIEQFIKNHPSDVCHVKIHDGFWGAEETVDISSRLAVNEEAEEAQRKAVIASLEASLENSIETLKTDSSYDLKYSQLETVIENHLLFPQLDENEDSEIYHLREDLYMLSLRHPNLQTVIQTRIISDKLDALQMAITGSAGAPQTTSGQAKWAPLAASVALSKLSNIEKDVDDVADGFLGED